MSLLKALRIPAACAAAWFVAGVCQAQFPDLDWDYSYEANPGEDAAGSGADDAFDALDGTFSHDNGSDEWDGSQIGQEGTRPGGAMVITEGDTSYLRIQDAGDPRDYGMGDPGSNRKIFLGTDLGDDGASASQLDEGLTVHFRARVATSGPLDQAHPDGGGGPSDWPAGGDGYLISDGGKNNFTIKQSAGGAVALALAVDADTLGQGAGLLMNNLNGTAITGEVDTGEAGTLNMLPLDTAQWHEYWVTIRAGGAGTHQVTVYLDGASDPAGVFDVTAGNGSDFGGITYLALGCGSTGQSGAFDVDFVRYKAGVNPPREPPVIDPTPVPALSGPGLALLVLLCLGTGAVAMVRRRRLEVSGD